MNESIELKKDMKGKEAELRNLIEGQKIKLANVQKKIDELQKKAG